MNKIEDLLFYIDIQVSQNGFVILTEKPEVRVFL